MYVKAPEIVISGEAGGITPNHGTDIHYKLFTGAGDNDGNPLYLWLATDNINQADLCRLGYRLMTDYYRNALGNGTVTVPDSVKLRESQFMISHGIISAEEYKGRTQDATQSQIYRVLSFAVGAGLTSISSSPMTRAEVASLVCDLTGRDKAPITNGLPLAYFTDKGPYAALINEVSNSHEYTLDSMGNETWISILNN